MNLFKNYTMTWQQAALLKASVLLIGIALGSYFHDVFASYELLFAVVGLAIGTYLASQLLS